MVRPKTSQNVRMREWIKSQEHPELFSVDGDSIFCQVCSKGYKCSSKYQLDQHAATPMHKANVKKYEVKPERQQLLKDAVTPTNSFYYELCEAFVAAGIAWNKLQNPTLRMVMEKYMKRSLPNESTLRKNYLPALHLNCIESIKKDIGDHPIWLQIDETTDCKGRFMANILIGSLQINSAGTPHLILVKQLERTNNATITQAVQEALQLLWPVDTQDKINKNFLLFLTDGVAYMLKAGDNLVKIYPKMIHVTCLAHALHLVADKTRILYKRVHKLISTVKKVFVKAPSRVSKFKELFPNLELPPEPVLTRWGTWLEAANYYASNIHEVGSVVDSFNDNDAASIPAAKELCRDEKILDQLRTISNNYAFIAASIKKLETSGMPLSESIKEVDMVVEKLALADSQKGQEIKDKLATVLAKNKGFQKLQQANKILSEGQGLSSYENCGIAEDLIHFYKFAPITTVDTERSFSMEKALIDGRENLSAQSIGKLLVTQFHYAKSC